VKTARGLTLIEVLAGTVLLSILAVACLPLLQSASNSLTGASLPESGPDAMELGVLADAIVEKLALAGLKDEADLLNADGVQIPWPDDVKRQAPTSTGGALPTAVLHCLKSNADTKPSADHAWLVVECQGQHVARWIKISKPSESGETP
jgi:prepilin-type N-terminal cleavage/methylation domain-containing protein